MKQKETYALIEARGAGSGGGNRTLYSKEFESLADAIKYFREAYCPFMDDSGYWRSDRTGMSYCVAISVKI